MPVVIRMARAGTKKRPVYHIVVADSRSPRDGRFIERLGYFNPLLPKDKTERLKLDLDKVKAWLAKGAQPSDRVMRFLDAAGVKKREARSNPQKAKPKKKAQERAAAAVAAAAVRSCAFFFGFAFSGLLRAVRFITPASSRKRDTRSVGSAPFAIQALTLSRSSLRRSLASLASSGLKWPSRSM